MFDIDQFTAVINPPEAGIIAVGSIVQKPVVVDATVLPRRRMRITMSCDHRVIDGATGAAFLKTLKQMLENPLAMLFLGVPVAISFHVIIFGGGPVWLIGPFHSVPPGMCNALIAMSKLT